MSIMEPFGHRLVTAIDHRGPLCVGIDPHPGLLQQWGLPSSVAGLERFAMTVVEALGPTVAVLKPQSAFFESYGSATDDGRPHCCSNPGCGSMPTQSGPR